jgi:hypothetical protein
MEEIFYVYVTTCLKNEKKYVGEHRTFYIESDPYIGSGIELRKDIKKFGKKYFQREILETFPTKEEAFIAQEKYIRKFNCTYPLGYNLNIWGGIGKFTIHALSDETKKRIGNANQENKRHHSKETKDQISKSLKNKKQSKEHIDKRVLKIKGLSRTEETKNQMRKSKLGKPSNNIRGINGRGILTPALNSR